MSKKKELDIFTSDEDVAKAFAPNQTAFFQEVLLDKRCPETGRTLNKIRKKEQEKAALYRRIQDANETIDFHKQHLLSLQKSKTPYYVYMVFVDGEVKYVGKGSGDRYKHPVSGCSSVKSLNKDYFDNKYIEVVFVQENLSEEVALKAGMKLTTGH